MLKPLLLLLSFEKKKIHSVSGCHDWVLLGAPNFIMHSQYISLMDLTCGKIDRFFSSFHAIRLQRLCKLSKTFYHISYLSSSSPGVICLVKLITYILPPFFLQQIMTINLVAKSACCLPLEGAWVFLPLAGFHGASPQL